MLLLLLACAPKDPCDADPMGYGCVSKDASHSPADTPDSCAGFGFLHSGVLHQFCVECGSIVCVYKTRSVDTLGGVEMEIRAPVPTDDQWVEYHDAFVKADSNDQQFRMELPLTITDDPETWVSNSNTLFNLRDATTMAEVDIELSIMLPDGTYPECVIWGNHPEKFTDSCEEVAGL